MSVYRPALESNGVLSTLGLNRSKLIVLIEETLLLWGVNGVDVSCLASKDRTINPANANARPNKTFHVGGSCRRIIPKIAGMTIFSDDSATIRLKSSA